MRSDYGTLAQMSFDDLQKSIASDSFPPGGSSILVQAMWHVARGDWSRAHACAQDVHDRDGAWVHAYLHRKEGDLGNAHYWYARAGRPMPGSEVALETEWAQIARELVGQLAEPVKNSGPTKK